MSLRRYLLVWCCAVLLSGAAWGDSRGDHKKALEAIESGQWQVAEGLLRNAIAERAEEKYTSLLNRLYAPHYFLGVVLQEQGRCRQALESFETSEGYGQIARSRYKAEIGNRVKECESLIQSFELAKVEAEQAIARAKDPSQQVAGFAVKKELRPYWNQGSPSFAERQEAAERKLADAMQRVKAGDASMDAEAMATAQQLAEEAAAELKAIARAGRSRLGEVNQAMAEELERLEQAEESARNLLRSVAPLAPYPPKLGSQISKLKDALNEVDRQRPTARSADLGKLSDQLTRETRLLRRLAQPPPTALAEAAEAFLASDYQRALDALVAGTWRGDRQRYHALVLQAACRYSLFILGGEQEQELHDLAVADIQAIAEMGSRPSVGESFLSPRFREFFSTTLRATLAQSDDADNS